MSNEPSAMSHERSAMSNELYAMSRHPLPNTYDQFHLKIIGDGPLKESLQNAVKEKGIENIDFTGRLDFNNAMEILQNSKFMIMPALCYEGFPMAIREAFACGKPVIASRLGAMAELV